MDLQEPQDEGEVTRLPSQPDHAMPEDANREKNRPVDAPHEPAAPMPDEAAAADAVEQEASAATSDVSPPKTSNPTQATTADDPASSVDPPNDEPSTVDVPSDDATMDPSPDSEAPITSGVGSPAEGAHPNIAADEPSTAAPNGEEHPEGDAPQPSSDKPVETTLQPTQSPSENESKTLRVEHVADRPEHSTHAPRVNYLPMPLSQQGGTGTSSDGASAPPLYFHVTVEGAATVADEATQRVAARIDKLIDERIDTKINDLEWRRACQMRAIFGK